MFNIDPRNKGFKQYKAVGGKKKKKAAKKYIDKHFYCIQHAMCYKYLMNLKEKKLNPHVLSMLLPTGEFQSG